MTAPLKILMLEDIATDAEIVKRLLKKEILHLEFRLVMNKDAYLQALDQFQPDLILCDNTLPQFNATEALAIFRQRSLLIPFILVTGTVSEEFAAGIIKLGADDYILKDRLARLPAAINAALKHRQTEKEKQETQQKLIESETRLRIILQTQPECVKLLGMNGELEDMNPAGLAMIEADRLEQVKGTSILDIIDKPYRETFDKLTKNIFQGKSGTLEFEITGLKGTHRWLETHAIPLKDVEGKIISLLGVTRDITEQKKATVKLKESEKKLRQVLSSTADNFYVIDRNYEVILINQMAERTLEIAWGKPVKQGTNILDVIPEEGDEPIKQSFEEVFKGKRIEYELYHSRHDLPAWVLINFTSVIDETGAIIGAAVVAKDITERKKAEKEIKESEEKYRTLVEQAADAIFIVDLEGNYLEANESAAKLTGYSVEELKKMNGRDISDPEDLKKNPLKLEEIKKGNPVFTERVIRRKDNTIIYVEISAKLMSNGRVIVIMRDITERKKAEEAIYQLNQNLEIRVKERTSELEKTNIDLEEINDLFVGREARIIELKEEMAELKNKISMQ